MKPHRRKRLGAILFVAFGLSVAVTLTLFALSQNINMFYSPTQVANGEVESGTLFRIGGMVKDGSVEQQQDSLAVNFVTTDFVHDVAIEYEGILPDLFREGQGIVAEGRLDALGVFQASRVLAKHDENYMSPEVRAALEQAGANPENHQFRATPED
ncbi:MAG: cytochrome c maturation protein CcmE [Gammaproteobacteria bacterium]|nr:cytochrome c maturation protein CcmE [Gammaproteobacteria bacterium]MCY3688967.1 cytochrome c maturation protein CcmE [Gammaproteobacteria bacterium]MDE0480286.1 cytochrome c maturation protein CcmE [Gammaproteobacteria bacterium]MXZ33645.1 cytochrome c maturation protein CcmE [Gammaproteobacteria bacterium]MYA37542.1 cytochrome c maturation protein CcmE [Gammaproteobacteria bacterium]